MNHIGDILSEIGRAGRDSDGSYSRGCYSPAYFDGLDIVERQMEELGMEVRTRGDTPHERGRKNIKSFVGAVWL